MTPMRPYQYYWRRLALAAMAVGSTSSVASISSTPAVAIRRNCSGGTAAPVCTAQARISLQLQQHAPFSCSVFANNNVDDGESPQLLSRQRFASLVSSLTAGKIRPIFRTLPIRLIMTFNNAACRRGSPCVRGEANIDLKSMSRKEVADFSSEFEAALAPSMLLLEKPFMDTLLGPSNYCWG